MPAAAVAPATVSPAQAALLARAAAAQEAAAAAAAAPTAVTTPAQQPPAQVGDGQLKRKRDKPKKKKEPAAEPPVEEKKQKKAKKARVAPPDGSKQTSGPGNADQARLSFQDPCMPPCRGGWHSVEGTSANLDLETGVFLNFAESHNHGGVSEGGGDVLKRSIS